MVPNNDPALFPDNEPPPYESVTATQLIESSTDVRGDGRIDVDLDSKLGYALSRLIQSPPDYSTLEPAAPPARPPSQWNIKLNIVIQVVGSRGDVQPFIALGTELQKHGHRVRLATHDTFREFVQSHGIEFYPIGGDPAELMAYMVRNPGLIPRMKSLQEGEIQRKRMMIAQMLDGCWNSCIDSDPVTQKPFVADAIIANPPSFAHIHCAQALGIPVHLMFTMPWSATKAFPHPLANLKYTNTDPKMANYISYIVVEWMTWQGLGDVVNKWRRGLDLDPIPMMKGPNLADALKIPFTYCWSPALVPKPVDWPSHIDICGFFFREPPAYTPSPELSAFLAAGPPPVYIGFGSIVVDEPEKLAEYLLRAIDMLDARAIISRGWSNLAGSEKKNIFYIGDCPHEWLFPRVAAVVHHGGAGTTACGLLNGKPTFIIPFFGDQPFWGNMVAAAGAGPTPIHHKDLDSINVLDVADAIDYCLSPKAAAAAEIVASKMRAESGVKAAVNSFHAHLPLERLACDVLPDQPAAWTYHKGRNPLRLSKLAAEILTEYMKIDRHRLELHETAPIIINPRHFDPVSSSVGVAVGTVTKVLKATSDIFTEPYKEFRRGQQRGESSSSSTTPTPEPQKATIDHSNPTIIIPDTDDDNAGEGPSTQTTSTLESRSITSSTSTSNGNANGWVTAGLMAGASAKSLGMWHVITLKSLTVDVPLACAEGFKALPALYGEPVRDHGAVRDWKSGVVVGSKSFVYNMTEGLSDIVVLPYKASKDEAGGLEVAKAVGKGTVSLATKPVAGAFGLIAYPFQGVSKSIQSLVRTKTRNRIIAARRAEGEWMVRMIGRSSSSQSQARTRTRGWGDVSQEVSRVDPRAVLETFERIRVRGGGEGVGVLEG